jgi:type II secretory pathway pseudopilin PulG
MGFLWRDTQAFLRQSKLAREAGKKTLAMGLVKEALDQARLAQQQARDQTDPDIFYPPNSRRVRAGLQFSRNQNNRLKDTAGQF